MKRDVTAVKAALDKVVNRDPDHRDRRAESGKLVCRYTEHGRPACLVGRVLYELGFSIPRLRNLDRAARGEPVLLAGSGLGRYFTPNAFELLQHLQNRNDWGQTWSRIREEAFTRGGVAGHGRKPWLVGTGQQPGPDQIEEQR